MPILLEEHKPLAPFTTFELGGPARYFAAVTREQELLEALDIADRHHLPVTVLGGGSNVIIADQGIEGLVVHFQNESWTESEDATVTVGAGVNWDDFVRFTCERDWVGLESLSGVPGTVGGSPVQNIGAYGQEVSDTIESVTTIDRRTRERHKRTRQACEFGYRASAFQTKYRHEIIVEVTFRLHPNQVPIVKYKELTAALDSVTSLNAMTVRQTVLELRRKKGMLLDDSDERRSVGSFFKNPMLDASQFAHLLQVSLQSGAVSAQDEIPVFETSSPAHVKVPAAWLIERSGFARGHREGAFGVSSRHALALIHFGGGTSTGLIRFSKRIVESVGEKFGVELSIEPDILGRID